MFERLDFIITIEQKDAICVFLNSYKRTYFTENFAEWKFKNNCQVPICYAKQDFGGAGQYKSVDLTYPLKKSYTDKVEKFYFDSECLWMFSPINIDCDILSIVESVLLLCVRSVTKNRCLAHVGKTSINTFAAT